ncbi:hypothetical protein T10_2217 [Trichinella papuae]|uniref:Uncharacterized protein n=1 Tax=Trichinella papuae TaxID=268474 RepID=A0A0V1M276_9BILA|nr:hypothetical protein T10_2217 [Trichinella papuae]
MALFILDRQQSNLQFLCFYLYLSADRAARLVTDSSWSDCVIGVNSAVANLCGWCQWLYLNSRGVTGISL